MIGSQDGREILADALRAFADVLSRRRQDELPSRGTRSNLGARWPVKDVR
ncbi:hypothetical protein ACFPNZ_13150 [Microvirga aerilata]